MRVERWCRVLADQDVERLHEASLTMLEKVGVKVHDRLARQALRHAGAKVDEVSELVRFPRPLVLEAIQSAPKQIDLCCPNGKILHVADGERYWTSGGDMLNVVNVDGAVRRATSADAANLCRLLDYSIVDHATTPVYAGDVPEALNELVAWETYYLNCKKHCLTAPLSADTADISIDLAEVVSEAYGLLGPCTTLAIYSTSPLQIDPESAQVLVRAVNRGVPVMFGAAPMAGGTAPFTLAGAVAQGNAEILSLVTLCQVLKRGMPFYYHLNASTLDLRRGAFSRGGPVYPLEICAGIQLANFYGFPCSASALQTDSALPDMQAGLEMMMIGSPVIAASPHLTGGVGRLTARGLFSYELVVIHSELLQMLERFEQGLDVSDATLALDVIERVGPGGNFIEDIHTAQSLRSGEHFYPHLFNREDTGESMLIRAHAKVRQILASYDPAIPQKVVEAVKSYAERKRAELTRKQA